MSLAQRTAALLALISTHQASRCEAILAPARAQARQQRKAALAEARRRVRATIAEERASARAAVAAAQARLATEERLHRQRAVAAVLERAHALLATALLAQWNTPAGRQRWIQGQLARCALPPGGAWQLTGPTEWNQAEIDAVAVALRALGAEQVTWQADPQLAAGFCIAAGHNHFDATLAGLLADRAAVDGRLLQALQEAA